MSIYNKSSPAYQRLKKMTRDLIRKKRRELRVKFVQERSSRCELCGFSDIRALEIHHLKKKNYFKEGRNQYQTLRLIPWDQLQLLCANCHLILENEERFVNV